MIDIGPAVALAAIQSGDLLTQLEQLGVVRGDF